MEKIINVEDLLINGSKEQVTSLLRFLHPADILDVLHEHVDLVPEILSKLPDDMIASIIEEEEIEDKYDLLKQFSEAHQKSILDEMAFDEITDMIGTLEEDQVSEVINFLDEEDQEDVKQLMSYSEESAGGIMDMILLPFTTIKQSKKH